jgi:hypothetical protein
VSKLDDILAAAKSGAENLPATTPQTGGSTALTQTSTSGTDMSTEAFLNSGGMDVEGYVNVNEFGIRLNKEWKGFLDSFEATIDLADVVYFKGIQKTIGKNVEYAKTYNGITTSKGENWEAIKAEYMRDSQKPASPYDGAEIPVTLTQGYDDGKGGKPVEADTTLGITTSITAFKPWQRFHKKLAKAGLIEGRVKVKITAVPRRNAGGQDYGVYDFEVLEVLD